jgi:ATP-binding cassette, subfamily B, bacterial PglK
MLNVIRKLFDLLTTKEKTHLLFLLVALIFLAFIEMAGIASIMPFMAVVANPQVIETHRWLSMVHDFLGFSNDRDFLLFLGILVLSLLVFSNFFKALMAWLTLRFDNNLNYKLAERLLGKYLARPYVFFLNRNTSELGKNVLNEVRGVIIGVLSPGMQIFSGGVIIFFIFALLLAVDPLIATSIAAILGGTYAGIYLVVRQHLGRIGEEQIRANALKFKMAGEALSGIKDLKILGREGVFLERFTEQARRHAYNNISAGVVAQLPRYALEVLAFGGILLIVLYFLRQGQGSEKIIPLMALYAFAGYRLLPALQQVFAGIASVRFGLAALNLLHHDMVKMQYMMEEEPFQLRPSGLKPLSFTKKIELRDISFLYPGSQEPVLNDINLSVSVNTTIGFVGATGSGKTTIVDLILGLLPPSSGKLLVDDVEIKGLLLARWQLNLGYVPQSIYLSDDTLTRNIAFGVPDADIDQDAVIRAARIANLVEFIEQELPDRYETIIGERGVRLSGGQRQRIGIARALYRDPPILILDEATSALDGVTEEAVMDAIRNLSRKKTIIMIAHRLSTVKDCDVIYLLEHGQLVAHGDYVSLQRKSQWFRTVAQATAQ